MKTNETENACPRDRIWSETDRAIKKVEATTTLRMANDPKVRSKLLEKLTEEEIGLITASYAQ